MSDIQIVPYGPEWEEKHKEFAGKYFNNRRRRILPHYIYWKFRGVEGKPLDSFLLAISDGKIVGQLGLVPCDITLNGQIFSAHWACDLMVDFECRGKGIAAMLYKQAVDQKITFGSDPSPAAQNSMLRFGFKKINGPVKLFFPIKLSTLSQKVAPRLTTIAQLLPNPFLFKAGLSSSLKNGLESYRVKLQDVDLAFLKSLKAQDSIYVVHDYDFYQWRLGLFEDFQEEGEIYYVKEKCFAAIRIAGKLGLITDFYAKDTDVTKAMLKSLIISMKKRGVEEVKFFVSNPQVILYARKLGFIQGRSNVDIIFNSKNDVFNSMIKTNTKFAYTLIDSDESI